MPQEPYRDPRHDAKGIQQVIKQNRGRFNRCFEEHLRPSPSLQNRVSIRFIIAADGTVKLAMDAGSELSDHQAIACMLRVIETLRFPAHEGGPMTVVYPLVFSPGGE